MTTSRNCQISPAVSIRISARGSAVGPSRRCASQGATSQASAPIGSAAAAQVARMPAGPYCRIGWLVVGRASSVVAITAVSFNGPERGISADGSTVGAAPGPRRRPHRRHRLIRAADPGVVRRDDAATAAAGYLPEVTTDLSTRFGPHGVSALAACFAAGALAENIASPAVTIAGNRYDRGPDAVIALTLLGALALVALRHRLAASVPAAAPLGAPLAAIALLGGAGG